MYSSDFLEFELAGAVSDGVKTFIPVFERRESEQTTRNGSNDLS